MPDYLRDELDRHDILEDGEKLWDKLMPIPFAGPHMYFAALVGLARIKVLEKRGKAARVASTEAQ